MDIYNVLSVLLATVHALEICGVSARYRQALEVAPLLNNVILKTGSMCEQEEFLSLSSRTQILFLYNGAVDTDPCVLHITNTDSNWHSMICIEMHEHPNFDCMQIFKFYFGDYPPQSSETYYSCKDVRQRVCKTGRSTHIIFNPSVVSEETSRIKFKIKISITNQIDKRSSPDLWSSWNDWSPWSSSWSSRNDWSPWSSSWSSRNDWSPWSSSWSSRNDWSPWSSSWSSWNDWSSWSSSWSSWNDWSSWSEWSSNNEKEEKRKGGSIVIILFCVFGLVFVFIIWMMCCKWIIKKHTGENHQSVSVQRPEYSTVPENGALHSEVQTHSGIRASDVNASMLSEESTNNHDINRLPNRGQEGVYQNHNPTITSLIEDYIASRDHHSHTVSSEPTLSNGDTHMTALRSSSALSTSHPPTITSLIEEYLASREHPETSGGQGTPALSSIQSPTRAAVNDSVSMHSSTADTNVTSQHDPGVTCSVSGPTITSLIEEYIATRNAPQASDQSTTASLPTTQAARMPAAYTNVTDSCTTSAHANISATAGPSPTLSSLIEEYLSTRISRIPSEQRHGHSPVFDNQPTSLEPPQYADVVSGRILGASTATGGISEDMPPPSYESLFCESES